MGYIYLDGEFLPKEEAKIPVMDRGFLFGDGVYTTIQVKEGMPLFLEIHLERLKENCRHLNILPPLVKSEWVQALIEKNQAFHGVWRLKILITGGMDPQMRLPERPYGHLIFTLEPFSIPPIIPLRLTLFPYPAASCHASFKSLAHLNRYYVMEYAKAHGYDDAVTTTESGVILEASFGNLLWINPDSKQAWTPSRELPLHWGVTLSVLKGILVGQGYHVQEVKWHLNTLESSLCVFRVNTMSGIRLVESLDKKKFTLNTKLHTWLKESFEEAALMSAAHMNH